MVAHVDERLDGRPRDPRDLRQDHDALGAAFHHHILCNRHRNVGERRHRRIGLVELAGLGKRGELTLVEPAVLVQRLDQRVGDGRFPCDGRGRRARRRAASCTAPGTSLACCGFAASSRARTVAEAFAISLRYRWRGIVGRSPMQVARLSSPSARSTSRVKPCSENSAPGLLTVLWITSSLPRSTSTSVTASLSTLRVEIAIKCAWLLLRAASISASSSSRSDRDSTGAATSMTSSNASERMVSGGAVSIGARRLESSALAEVSMYFIKHWKTSSNSLICSCE